MFARAVVLGLLFAGVAAVGGAARADPTTAKEPPAVVDDIQPAWSPDGRRIAFVRTIRFSSTDDRIAAIFVVGTTGKGLRRLTAVDRLSFGPAWSPDGKRLAFVRLSGAGDGQGALYTMRLDGTSVRYVKGAPPVSSVAAPAWAPDGKTLAVESGSRLHVGSPAGGTWRAIARGRNPAWAPSQRIAYVRGCAIVSVKGDGTDEKRHAGGDVCIPELGLTDPDWSRSGRLTFTQRMLYRTAEARIAVTAADGATWRLIGRGADSDWSPDGRLLVFSRPPHGWTGWRLHLMRSDGTNVRRLKLRR